MMEKIMEEFEDDRYEDYFSIFEEEENVPEPKEGILSKIGNFVISILAKFYQFLSGIADAVFGKKKEKEEKDLRDDIQIVNDMLEKHPEFREQVANAIDKEWLTFKDVSKYENDIVGLMNSLQRAQIDKETFLQKLKRKKDDFIHNGGLTTFAVTASTVTTAIVGVLKLKHWMKSTKENANKATNESVSIYEGATDKANLGDGFKGAVTSAFGEARDEYVRVAKNYSKFRSFIHNLAEKFRNMLEKKVAVPA